MRILLLVDDYLPHSTKIGAKMMHELGAALFKAGHSIYIVTPDHQIEENYKFETLDGVEIYRFKSGNVKHESKVKRAINETLLSYNAWKNLKIHFKNKPCDLIVYYSPSIFFGSLVKRLKQKWNAKSYLILRDIFPQWIIDNGMIKEKSLIASYFKKFEQINYRVADKIGLQSPKNRDWFTSKFGLEEKTEVLYNWSNEVPVQIKESKFRDKFNLKDKVVFFYGGNMGEAQDMMNLVRLAEKLSDNAKAHFVFTGSGNEFQLVRHAISEKSLKNVLLLKPVPQKDYSLMLSEFDIGLFTLNAKHSTHNFPGKLLGYMSQKIPILGSVNSGNDIIDIIEDSNAGYVTVNPDDEQFAKNAKFLLEDSDRRKNMGNNAYKLLQNKFSVQATVEAITAIAN